MAIGSRVDAARGPHRLSLSAALAIAAGLVVLRSLVFVLYEQAFFDSDQAIIGLMAMHLVDGRALPLFYYGQGYLLGIDAFAAAPFFLILGPTVAALHLGIVALNVAAVIGLIVALVRSGLSPAASLLASSFFAFAPPLTSASLIEAGANIGPVVCVPFMWLVRRNPAALGVVAALGFVNREFTLYGIVAMGALDVWTRRIFARERIRYWVMALTAATAVIAAVSALRPFADSNGPGTRGERPPGFSGDAATNIASRMDIDPADLPVRALYMVRDHIPEIFGLRAVDSSIAPQGHPWLFWPFLLGLVAAAGRALWTTGARVVPKTETSWYFALTGAAAIAVYTISKPPGVLVPRYLLLAVFFPIGLVALELAVESMRKWRIVTATLVALWIGGSAWDHALQVRRYMIVGEPNETRELANLLESRGITIAESDYWIAYKLSFLSQERIKVASGDVVRVSEYQRLAAEAGPSLLRIEREPCDSGERVLIWYLCRAAP